MFQVAPRSFSTTDQLNIFWWRIVISVARLLARVKQPTYPIVRPLLPYVWLPVLALAGGIVIGWFIGLA